MTKVEALNKVGVDTGTPRHEQAIYKAMDEYAKRFGENLIGWLNDNDFKFTRWKDNMQSDSVNNGARMHASEVIDLFIEQQNKDK